MRAAGLKRGVVIVDEPADRRDPRDGQPARRTTTTPSPAGSATRPYAKLLDDPNKPLLNHAIQAHYPPGSTYKLVTGTGALADTRSRRRRGSRRGRTCSSARRSSGSGTTAAGARSRSSSASPTRATRSSSSSPACSGSIGSPTGPRSTASARRPASICPARWPGSSRRTRGSRRRSASTIFPGEAYQAGIGQGYDVVTPIQLINAYAALANGGKLYQPQIVREVVGPDGTVVRPFEPKLIRKLDVPRSDAQDDARGGPQRRPRPPHLQPRRPADRRRRQVRHGRVRPPRQQGPPAVPLVVRGVRPEEPGEDRATIRPG